MYPQFAAALPGASVIGERLTMKSGEGLLPDAEAFYETFLSGDLSSFPSPRSARRDSTRCWRRASAPFPR